MRRLAVLVVVALALSSCSEKKDLDVVLVPTAPLPGLANLPTRTKAVHIFVVPDDIANNAAAVESFAVARHATRNDVFIVGSEAKSYSYSEKRLLPIIEAAGRDWEAIPFIDVLQKEQLQWQSENEFELTGIEKYNAELVVSRPQYKQRPFQFNVPKDAPTPRDRWTMKPNASAPGNPFARLAGLSKERIPATAATGSTQKSLRTGIANVPGDGQLYRLSLAVTIDGKRRDIAPGVFVFACPRVTDNDKEKTCYRRHVSPSDYPNRTKVVRITTVDSDIADNAAMLQELVMRDSISESDVLIVRGEPMSYVHSRGLTDHEEAIIDDHPVVYVMVQELEQLQWEANSDFVITSIDKKPRSLFQRVRRYKELDINVFNVNRAAPRNPFPSFTMPTEFNRQFISGVANLIDHRLGFGQLYKLSFDIMIDGRKISIDPDFYCDM